MIKNLSRRLERIQAHLMPAEGLEPIQIRIITSATGEVVDRFLATPDGPKRPWLETANEIAVRNRKS
jgi:hypothetical protein